MPSPTEPNRPPTTPSLLVIADAKRPFVSLSDALGGHRNSLGLLRLIFAALVIVDHAFPLGGFGHDPLWDHTKGQASFGSIAVLGFFAISGYLIAKSGMSADTVQFMWRRVLRIFPALWLVLLVTAFGVAPIIWMLDGNSLAEYFSTQAGGVGPFGYVLKNFGLSVGSYGIHDIFATTTPYGEEVNASVLNGSLWTLIYEFQAYLLIGVLVLFGVMTRARVVVPALAVLMALAQIMSFLNWDAFAAFLPFLADPQRPPLLLAFLVGSTLAVYSKKVPFDDGLGILAGIVVLGTLRFGGFSVIGTIAGAYFVMYLAARLPRRVQWIGAKNDYSYGIYVYGFLVQQTLAYFGVHKLGYVPFVLIALIVAFAGAWLSWHLVEKRAMALKDWGPGRGWRYWAGQGQLWLASRRRRSPSDDASSAVQEPKD